MKRLRPFAALVTRPSGDTNAILLREEPGSTKSIARRPIRLRRVWTDHVSKYCFERLTCKTAVRSVATALQPTPCVLVSRSGTNATSTQYDLHRRVDSHKMR